MRKFLSLIVVLMFCFNVKAQTSLTEAVDFSFSADLKDKTLFEVLDGGQHVLLYFFNYQAEATETITPIVNGVYNSLGKNKGDVYVIGLDPANESILLNNWAAINEVEYPLVDRSKAYSISQTYGGSWGVMLPTLVLIAPNHQIILKEIWPITSVDQVVATINNNLVTDDGNDGDGDDNEGEDDTETPAGLAVPTNVVVTANGETSVILSWDAVEGATEYNIYTPSTFSYNVLGITETSYTFENLTAGTQYCFEVSAVSATDESDTAKACGKTNEAGEEPGDDDGNDDGDDDGNDDGNDEGDDDEQPEYPEPTTVPDAPVIEVYAENSGLVVIEWPAVETAVYYSIYYQGAFFSDVFSNAVEVLVYPETTYCFTVTATNTVGESEHSNEGCATTPAEEGTMEILEGVFSVSPNPASSEVRISSAMNGEANVSIYDMTGRCVKEIRVADISDATINVSDINKGVYFINVDGNVKKLIIK